MSESEEDNSIGSNTDYETSSDMESIDGCESNDSTKKTEDFNYLAAYVAEEMFNGKMMQTLQTEFPEIYDFDSDSENCDTPYFSDQASKCTYAEGYMKRQNIYTCLDCNKQNNQLGALCFGCIVCCHRKHNVIELYSKRNYRCDCGNERNNSVVCELYPGKELFNSKNVYNDNFRGLYCVCKQPYDAYSTDNNNVMIQCVICEDWFHADHLDKPPPKDSSGKYTYDEFICFLCSNKYSYLSKYIQVIENKIQSNGESTNTTLKETDNHIDSYPNNVNSTEKLCVIKNIPLKSPFTSLFMPPRWRNYLCQCDDCSQIYQTNGHTYLLDSEDVLLNDDEDSSLDLSDYMFSSGSTPRHIDDVTSSETDPEFHRMKKRDLTTPIKTSADQKMDKDTPKNNNNKSAEGETSDSHSENSKNKHTPDTTKENFVNDMINSKKPVKVNLPDETIDEFHKSKHPKYDDNQNL